MYLKIKVGIQKLLKYLKIIKFRSIYFMHEKLFKIMDQAWCHLSVITKFEMR